VENKDAAENSIEVKVDDRDPSIDSTRTPAANAFGWNRGPVAVAFTCDDIETGIKEVGGCVGDTTLSAEGEGQSVTGTATDNAGNKQSKTVVGINIDLTDPLLSGTATEAPNAAGWYKGDVTVRWSASDPLSGIDAATHPDDSVITGEGANLGAGPVGISDKAGNTTSASVSGIKIDRTAPVITGAPTTSPNANGWYRHAVTVAFDATDNLSGVATPPSDKVLDGDGANQSLTSDPVLDEAGNQADGKTVGGINVDSHAPVSTSTLHCTSQNSWCKGSTATLELSAQDQFALSGVDSIHYSVDGGEYVKIDGASTNVDVPLSGSGKAVVDYYAVDEAGNVEGGNSVSIRWDNLAPVVTHTVNPATNADGWNQLDTTVHFDATDEQGGSGITFISPDVLVSDETDGRLVEGQADDIAGNRGTDSVTVKLDKTPPTIRADRTPANADGWNNGPVTVHFSCADALSHVKQCTDDVTLTAQGANQSASGTATDTAGNSASATVSHIDIDRTKPELTGTATTDANANGWYNDDVTIHWTATDDLSGVEVSAIPADSTIIGQGDDLGASATVSDRAGNVGTGSVHGVRIDLVAPTTTLDKPAPLASGWYAGGFSITLAATDNLSGVDATYYSVDNGPAHAVSGAFDYDTPGMHTLRYWSVDQAANVEDKVSVELKLDNVPPTISAGRTPAANQYGWNNGPVTAHFACGDAQTGIAQCEADHDFTHEGAAQSKTGTAVDNAGTTATATVSDVNIDLTDPTLSGAATTAPNANGWYQGDVTIHWTADDALSGIEHAPANDALTGEGDSLGASASVSDRAGNSTTASVNAIKIDRHDPSTTLHVPALPTSGWYQDKVPVTLTATDNLSQVDKTYYTVDDRLTPVLYDSTFDFGRRGTHTLTYWSVDNAGNVEAKATTEIRIDNQPPAITGNRAPSANTWGWNKGDVIVHFECSDGDSGVAGCDPDTTLANEGANQSVTGTASDVAGNHSSTVVDGINIDKAVPTLAGVPTEPANAAGWWNHDVTLHWNAADGLSGIDPNTVPANSTVTGEGASLGAGPVSVSDKAGNATSASVSGLKIDRTSPTISASKPAPNAAGWYSAPLAVTYACADNLSGVASCPAKQELTGDGAGQSVTSDQALDLAGNPAPGVTTAGINIDSKAPQSTATESCGVSNGYCQSSATVRVEASDQDGLSGVKELHYTVNNGPEQTVAGSSATINVSLNGTGAANVSYWAVDNAGNAEPKNGVSLKYDNIAPTVTHVFTPAANAGGWDKGNTLVHFDAVDDLGGSGVNPGTVTPDTTVSSETGGQVLTGQALDMAGNKGTDSATVKLDKTAPTITGATTTPPNANGWYSGPVTVHFTCSDALSGIALCPAETTLTANGAGQQVSGTAVDKADNSKDTFVSGINIDATKPAIGFTGVTDGGIYTIGAVPAAGCTATDSGSGLSAPCSVTSTGGTANGVGTYTASATATDKAGNRMSSSISYRVIYRWDGFLQPINDTAHQVGVSTSIFKGGSTVPTKLQLRKADGSILQANTPPKWLVPAKGNSTAAAVDESVYGDAATSGTTYAWDGQQYQYNWSTKGLASGFYWRIGVVLDDGQTYDVNIGLR
jgi:uncharacterized protein YjbJ (UPF0337 family)